jgi:hypothetical protein
MSKFCLHYYFLVHKDVNIPILDPMAYMTCVKHRRGISLIHTLLTIHKKIKHRVLADKQQITPARRQLGLELQAGQVAGRRSKS